MKIYITGRKGFIGKNLSKKCKERSISVLEDQINAGKSYVNMMDKNTGEMDIVNSPLDEMIRFFEKNEVEIVVHNAAIVGTDVCAQFPNETWESNIVGTKKVCKVCKSLNIPILYIGTTVIYDTSLYQQQPIKEYSIMSPKTLYAQTKLIGEKIVEDEVSSWSIIRPLFCYGGIGDMNSLIAKSIYNHFWTKKKFKIFLDPLKTKSYMHVDDFCEQISRLLFLWKRAEHKNFNAANSTTYLTSLIVDMMEEKGIKCRDFIEWVPEADYLGNHVIDATALNETVLYSPQISLSEGIDSVISEIGNLDFPEIEDYNPLYFLERIEKEKIDISVAYPKK